ncbi:MAG: sulfite exporter TauE/SafE family protein [Actinobacteria bacterium]|nr:sulfite exporter TauE/SafE family protein [Actinomycetota bacterium]
MTVLGPLGLAFLAGILSFTSPCCLPLMPGYLSYVGGVSGDEVGTVAVRRRVLVAAALFVVGFSVVFTALGAGAALFGGVLLRNRRVVEQAAGVFVIGMGLVLIGALRFPFLYREVRMDPRRVRAGPLGAVPLGMAFAFGWTPCIGPVLAGILTAAAATETAAWGAALLLVYSLGLGVPFLLLALGYARAGRAFGWFRRHGRLVERVGGAVLLLMGALMVTGTWTRLFIPLVGWFSRNDWPPI